MSGKTFGPSSRDSSRSPSPTSTKSASPKATPNLTSEGVSPGSPKAKASPEKSKEKTKDKTEKNKGGKSQGNPGKDKKPGKPTGEEFYSSIPAGTPFAKLGSLKDVAADPEAFAELLVQKLELCMQVYNFQKDDCMPEKEGKRFTLLEILHYWPSIEKEEVSKTRSNKKSPAISADDAVNSSTGPLFSSAGTESSEVSAKALTTPVLAAAVKVVRANAFRSMMHKERTPMDLLDGDDDEPLLEPTWPHLELVYELLMKIISAKDVDYSAAQSAGLDKPFVICLVNLMDTDDPREREVLKNLITKLFSKISNFRSTVRKSIQSFCQRAVSLEHGEAPAYGLSEVLEILAVRIVSGFATPLRKEQKDLLTEILMPLYKLDFLVSFHSQLKDVVRIFCKKDATLIKPVAQALLRYWPHCASSKQTIFLGELEDMIHTMPAVDFKSIGAACAQQISACCVSCHSEVAEKALGIWRHQPTVRSTVQNCREELPLVVSRLYSNVTQAWGPNVMSKTMDVLKNFMEADRELFDNCSSKHRKQADEADKKDAKREQRWAALQAMHDRAHPERVRSAAIQTKRQDRDREVKESGRPQLLEEVILKPDSSCALALSWDWADEPMKQQLLLKALLVNTDGKIVDAVHTRNITCFQSAVRLTARAPPQSQKDACCGTIWVSLDILPVDVAMIIYVVTPSTHTLLGEIAHNMSVAVDFNGNAMLGEINAEPPPNAKMGVVAYLKRLDWSSWSLVPKIDWTHAEHFMDAGEMLNKVVKEVLPSIPKKQRAQASFVAMSKGSVADCPVFHTAKGTPARVFVGVGWDFFDDKTSKIDVALVFFSMDGHHISTVSKDGETIKGAFHTGHGALSAGVFVEFDLLPIEVSVAFLVAHVSTEGSDYSTVQQPHCTVIDAQGREILRYFMPEDKRKPSGQTGLIMARMFWNQFHERWSFQALGNYCGGSSWSDSLEDMKALVTIPPSHFQTLLIEDEDSVMRGDHRSTTAASSSAQSVIMSL